MVPLVCDCTVWVVVPDLGHFLFHVTGFVCKGEFVEQRAKEGDVLTITRHPCG